MSWDRWVLVAACIGILLWLTVHATLFTFNLVAAVNNSTRDNINAHARINAIERVLTTPKETGS